MAISEQVPVFPSEKKTRALSHVIELPWMRDILSLLVMAVTVVSVYFPIIVGRASVMTDTSQWPHGSLFVGDPAAGGQITYYKELAVMQAWSHLHLPLWLPTEGYGITLAGNQAAPWFLPEIVMHMLFANNLSLWNVLCVLLASIGAYALARHLGLGWVAAIASGLIYSLSGPIVANLNLDMINPLAVTPYAIVAALKLVESSSNKRRLVLWWALAALAISQLFLSGFAEALPLEMVLVGSFVLVRNGYLARSLGEFARLTARWVGATVVGVVGSLIASVALIQPLSTYRLFQPAGAELAAQPMYWWLTLIDPWAFGRSLAGGPFEAGLTVWVPGNPLIFMFVTAAVLALLRGQQGWSRGWRIAMTALIVFGLLGFANTLGVLNVLRIPPLDLIYSPRFLPFLWWLPAALMAGAGLEAVNQNGRWMPVGALTATILAGGVLVADVFVKGGTIFSAINSKNLSSTIGSNLPVAVLLLLGAVAVITAPRRWRAAVGLLGVAAMVLVLVPRNFFPVLQAPKQLKSVAQIIRRAGLENGLSFSPGDYTVPSGLIGSGIPSIQAFDVFFPKGYSETIAHYFGQGNPMSTASPLYPSAPSMINVPVNGSTIGSLRKIGVMTVVVPFQLNSQNLTEVSLRSEPPGMGVSAGKYQEAMQALVSVYLSRPDLVHALRLPVSQWGLVQWPMVGAKVGDNSALSLEQYFPVYRRVVAFGGRNPSVLLFKLGGASSLRSLGVRLLGVGSYLGVHEYVYAIGGPSNVLPVVAASRVYPDPVGNNGTPIPLDGRVAYVPTSAISSVEGSSGLEISVSKFVENASGIRFDLVANHRGLVFLRRQIAPGEQVTVNHRQVDVVPVDNFLTGVMVSGGKQVIVISYESPLLLLLFWSAVVINVVLLAVACFSLIGRGGGWLLGGRRLE